METNELTAEDWQQIAAFYQGKFNELEMKVLTLELQQHKAALAEEAVKAEQSASSKVAND